MANFKKNSLYRIIFYDHCVGQDKSMQCKVVGWVVKNTKEYVVLSHWKVIDDDSEIVDNNHEFTTIIKSTIIDLHNIPDK